MIVSQVEEVVESYQSETLGSARELDIGLTVSNNPVAAYENEVNSGGQLREADFTIGCTGGFTASIGGAQGILTAEHCLETSARYQHLPGTTLSSLGIHSSLPVSLGDVRFRSTSLDTTNFQHYHRSDHTVGIRITSTTGLTINDYAAVFGRATGQMVDRIYSIGECYGNYCGLHAFENHVTTSGDSGGPVRIGQSAAGIHSGGPYIDGQNRSVFTPIYTVMQELDVAVRITP